MYTSKNNCRTGFLALLEMSENMQLKRSGISGGGLEEEMHTAGSLAVSLAQLKVTASLLCLMGTSSD